MQDTQRRKLWFKAQAESKSGYTHWFTIYRDRTVVIEAVISTRKRKHNLVLPNWSPTVVKQALKPKKMFFLRYAPVSTCKKLEKWCIRLKPIS